MGAGGRGRYWGQRGTGRTAAEPCAGIGYAPPLGGWLGPYPGKEVTTVTKYGWGSQGSTTWGGGYLDSLPALPAFPTAARLSTSNVLGGTVAQVGDGGTEGLLGDAHIVS